MIFRVTIAVIAILGVGVIAGAADDEPAYMGLDVGSAVEVSGEWEKGDSVFVAEEVELLPKPRRPKLRGQIQHADSTSHQIMMFGLWIAITGETQFLNVEGTALNFSILTKDTRAEASCKVDSTGQWICRHIRVNDVKGSDKIKGTITAVEFDGTEPDGFDIDGLRIRVNDETVIFKTLGTVSGEDNDDE